MERMKEQRQRVWELSDSNNQLRQQSMCLCSHLTSPYKHHSDLMGVIRRHLVQNLHSAVNHLPQRINIVKKKTLEQIPGQPQRSTNLSFGQQQRLVGFIPKERRVVELEEDKAGGYKTK